MLAPKSASAGQPAPSPAVAPPPGNPRFPLIDSVRAIAVISVVIFHVTSITNANAHGFLGEVFGVSGNLGLILFFVISGFLLYRPFVAARARGVPMPGVARYARRRLLRIVPAYWLALTVLAVYPGIVGPFGPHWWRYYLFLTLYSHRTIGSGIPVAWTLCVEVSFYVVLPLWAVVVRSWRVGAGERAWLTSELSSLCLIALSGVAIQVMASRLLISDLVADSLLGESVWFALGMALAVLSVADSQDAIAPGLKSIVLVRSGLCWTIAGGCLLGVAALLHPGSVLNILVQLETKQPVGRTLGALALTGILMILLVSPAVFGEGVGGLPRRVLAWRPLAKLGVISYGVYLYHLTLAELLGEQTDLGHFSASGLGLAANIHHLTTPILFVLTVAGSAAAAAVSYRFFELPFLRLKETASRTRTRV